MPLPALVTPLALLFGSLWALGRQDLPPGQQPHSGPGRQPPVSPEARARLAEARLAGGQIFKAPVRSAVLTGLARFALEPVEVKGRGQMYKVCPMAAGAMTALQAIQGWTSRGYMVLGSFSLVGDAHVPGSSGADRLIFVGSAEDAAVGASPLSHFAILGEPSAAPAAKVAASVSKAKVDVTTAQEVVLDQDMPAEIRADVLEALSAPGISIVSLRAMAGELAMFPLAQKALVARAGVLELRAKLRAAAATRDADGLTAVGVAPEASDSVVEVVPAPKKSETNGLASHVTPTPPASSSAPPTVSEG